MLQCHQNVFCLIFFNYYLVKALVQGTGCQNGGQLTYTVTYNRTSPFLFSALIKKTKITVDDCTKSCTFTSQCVVVIYDNKLKTCTLHSRSVFSGSQLQVAIGTDYYQKLCLNTPKKLCSTFLTRIPQQFLVGVARDVITVPKLEDCLTKCMMTVESTSDYNCVSLIYYYDDKSCILNTETRKNFPELITNTLPQEGRVDYMDNACFDGWGSWGPWSDCFPNGTQKRQRFCSSIQCEGTATSTQNCHPEVQQHSTKPPNPFNCPEATMYFGCNQYCKNFTSLGYSNYPDCLRNQAVPKLPTPPLWHFT